MTSATAHHAREAAVPVVVLAAGGSRRLGAAKQLVAYRGQTLVAHAIATARGVGCGPVLVVLGAALAEIREAIAGQPVRVVANPAWAEGMGSSLRAAVAAIEADFPAATAALFTVCDQPLVTADLLGAIVGAHRAGHDLVAAAYGGALGVPALLGRRYFAELQTLPGDVGARRILARHVAAVHAIAFPGGVVDVDTPADAAALADLASPGPT